MGGDSAPQGRSSSLSAQVPPSPPRPALAPSSSSLSVQLPPLGSPFEKNCVKQVAPADTQGMHENSTYDELHLLRTKRGYAQTDSKAALKAPLNTVAAVLHGRARDVVDAMEPRPSLSTYKRNVAPFGLRFG